MAARFLKEEIVMSIVKEPFGVTKGGEEVSRFRLTNGAGMSVDILEYGATIQSILVPSKNGKITDVVLGYDTLQDYEQGRCFFGALVGRYANRICDGEVRIDGKTCQMEKNDGDNHLHGCFPHRVFSGNIEDDSLKMTYRSPDGEDGLPGNVEVTVRYRLDEENGLSIVYEASSDQETILNLTNHSYFNLNGFGIIHAHRLIIDADSYTETDEGLIPTGQILPVEGTPLDFRQEKLIGKGLVNPDPSIRTAEGYDHNYVLNKKGKELELAARARGEVTGIVMECWTTQPGLQFYTGNYIQEDSVRFAKKKAQYPQYGGFCLETQHYPDSPHHPSFPDTVLRPGERYLEETVYRFLQ